VLDDLERSQDAELHVSSSRLLLVCGGDATTAGSAEAQRRLSGGTDHRWWPLPAA